jgi:RNA polymerase sigma factor
MPGLLELDTIVYFAWKRYKYGDNTAVDDIYDRLLPFCLRVCSKTCGKYISTEDEEASIARLAIVETFEKYDPEKGKFLVYLGRVIKNRIIDYKRSEKKHFTVPLSILSGNRDFKNTVIDDTWVENILDELARKQEIEFFRNLLKSFNISFSELVKSGPKQSKSRKKAQKIAWMIVMDKEIKDHLIEKKVLPIKLLEERCLADRKIIDRYRKFIIANVLIIIYDLPYLKPYVVDKGGEYGG